MFSISDFLALWIFFEFLDIFNTCIFFLISSSNLKNKKGSRPNLQIEIVCSFKNEIKVTFA